MHVRMACHIMLFCISIHVPYRCIVQPHGNLSSVLPVLRVLVSTVPVSSVSVSVKYVLTTSTCVVVGVSITFKRSPET